MADMYPLTPEQRTEAERRGWSVYQAMNEPQPGGSSRSWYETAIEAPIRPLVRLLRDNGINTTCSCGHKMYVECESYDDEDVTRVFNLLLENGYKDFTVELCWRRLSERAHRGYRLLTIRLHGKDAAGHLPPKDQSHLRNAERALQDAIAEWHRLGEDELCEVTYAIRDQIIALRERIAKQEVQSSG